MCLQAVLTRLCGCDKLLQALSMELAQLQVDKVSPSLRPDWLITCSHVDKKGNRMLTSDKELTRDFLSDLCFCYKLLINMLLTWLYVIKSSCVHADLLLCF